MSESTIQVGLPISKITALSGTLSKQDYFAVSQYRTEDEYQTRKAHISAITDAISSDIYLYTINNLSTITPDISYLSTEISTIQERIPYQTYDEGNELADKKFVNSSIQTNTAEFRGTYSISTDLPKTGIDNNDYAFVTENDLCGVVSSYNRYKYRESLSAWQWEYKLNNSGFTAVQWSAINSGITTELVSRIPSADKIYITTDHLDGTTIKYKDNKVNVGTITTSQISDIGTLTADIESRVKKDSIYSNKWTFYMKDGSTFNFNVVLSVI